MSTKYKVRKTKAAKLLLGLLLEVRVDTAPFFRVAYLYRERVRVASFIFEGKSTAYLIVWESERGVVSKARAYCCSSTEAKALNLERGCNEIPENFIGQIIQIVGE